MKRNHLFFGFLLMLFGVSLFVLACEKSEGDELTFAELGLKTCDGEEDIGTCGVGRYCKANEDGQFLCTADCFESKDCYNMLSEEEKKTIAANPDGLESSYYCSKCGRCVLEGEDDLLCEPPVQGKCKSDDDCEKGLLCINEYCELKCKDDNGCTSKGSGWYCKMDAPEKYCYAKCIDNQDCAYQGWAYSCKLPEGVVESENRWGPPGTMPVNMGSYASVEGECVKQAEPLDFGADETNVKPGDELLGVWGALFTTPTTTTGIPLVNKQDTYSINHLLLKVTREDDGKLYLSQKWCFIKLQNFKDTSYEPFDDLAYMVTPQIYTDSIPVQVSEIDEPASLDLGTYFHTVKNVEVRGAILDDPINDPLPSRHEEETLSKVYDQDKDGNPGLTTKMVGVLQGEVYSIQRWDWSYHGNILENGENLRIGGFMEHGSDQPMIGSNKESMIYDTNYSAHHDHTRSYFRFQKMDDDANCKEILDLGTEETNADEWLQFTYHFGGDNEHGNPMDETYYKNLDVFWDTEH